MAEATAPEQQEAQVEFNIQKIYTQDTSFESPNTPSMFKGEWKPEANIELNTNSEKLDDNNHNVDLTVTVTAKNDGKTAFIIEVKQSGIFSIGGTEEAQLGHILGSFCPSILFPYARAAIANLISRGGFPELQLSPINFDALYAQSLEEQAKQETKH